MSVKHPPFPYTELTGWSCEHNSSVLCAGCNELLRCCSDDCQASVCRCIFDTNEYLQVPATNMSSRQRPGCCWTLSRSRCTRRRRWVTCISHLRYISVAGVALHVPEGLRIERHLRTLDLSVKRNVLVSSPHQIFRAWYGNQRVEVAFRSKFCSLFSHSKGCSGTKIFTVSCNLRVEGSASLLRAYQHSSAVRL